MGFAVDGRGNLAGGFKGRLAVAAPRLTPGACSLDQFRAFVDVGVIARRPQVKGPIGAVALHLPGQQSAADRAAGRDQFAASPRRSAASTGADG